MYPPHHRDNGGPTAETWYTTNRASCIGAIA